MKKIMNDCKKKKPEEFVWKFCLMLIIFGIKILDLKIGYIDVGDNFLDVQ